MQYVYCLICKDGYYIGCTDSLKERLIRHSKGYVLATKNRRPICLKLFFGIDNKYQAFAFEKYLRSGSGRAFLNKHFHNRH